MTDTIVSRDAAGVIHYGDHVDYETLDSFGARSMRTYSPTSGNINQFGARLLPESIGGTARVYEFEGVPFYIATTVEILGTKVDIAVKMAKRDWDSRGKYFKGVGQDTANMALLDLLATGAQAIDYSPVLSIGNNDFLKDDVIVGALLDGYLKAANDASCTIAGGETGTCKGIIVSDQADLAGGAMGIINPRERFCHPGRIKAGDKIFGVKTISPHANGFTGIRKVESRLKHGYFTMMPSGRTFGEAVLEPTPGYGPLVRSFFDAGTEIHFMQAITGHGFKKLARGKQDFTYVVTNVPNIPPIFRFLQEKQGIDTKEMFETFNGGIGWVFYLPGENDVNVIDVGRSVEFDVFEMGYVQDGPRKVLVEPYDFVYEGKDL